MKEPRVPVYSQHMIRLCVRRKMTDWSANEPPDYLPLFLEFLSLLRRSEADLAALDAAWEEAAVRFGPGEAMDGCSTDRLRSRLRAASCAAA